MPASEPTDDRLKDLLAVEQRLQQRISNARSTADRRLADARAAHEHLLAGVAAAVAEADRTAALQDQTAHDEARKTLLTRHQAVIDSFSSTSDAQIEHLARRLLDRLLDADGGSP